MPKRTSSTRNPFRDIFERVRPGERPSGGELSEDERALAVTKAIGETIPFMATAGVHVEVYTPSDVVVALPDRTAVHNHVGTPHAAALALLAEAATGLVVALNLPDGAVPLLRTLSVDFSKMATGRVTARASLSAEERERIASRPIGKIDVDVELRSSSSASNSSTDVATDASPPPVKGVLQWAWIPEERLKR